MHNLIRFAFNQFYTTFAWTYDAVAYIVSFGEWKDWGRAALPFLSRGGCLLEIAHGPGHLHLTLRQADFDVVAIDLSPQMGRLARDRVHKTTGQSPLLARANAMRLPFADRSFACAVSTFPTDFIFKADTLSEVRRVLQPGGRFVVVPGTRFHGDDPVTRAIEFAYRITGQREAPTDVVRQRFESAGFTFEQHAVQTRRARVIVWTADKTLQVSETCKV